MRFWVLFTNPLFWPMTPSFWQCEGQIKPWGSSSLIVAADTLAGKYGCSPSQRFNVSGHHGVGSSSIVLRGGEVLTEVEKKTPSHNKKGRSPEKESSPGDGEICGEWKSPFRWRFSFRRLHCELFIYSSISFSRNQFYWRQDFKRSQGEMSTGFMGLFKSLCDNCTSSSSVLMPFYLKYWIPSEAKTFSLALDVGQTLYSCRNEYRRKSDHSSFAEANALASEKNKSIQI